MLSPFSKYMWQEEKLKPWAFLNKQFGPDIRDILVVIECCPNLVAASAEVERGFSKLNKLKLIKTSHRKLIKCSKMKKLLAVDLLTSSISGPWCNKKRHHTSIGNPIVEIRRPCDRLISTMGFPIPVGRNLYIESGLWFGPNRYDGYLHSFMQWEILPKIVMPADDLV